MKPIVIRILLAGFCTSLLGAQQPDGVVDRFGDNIAGWAGAALTGGAAAKFAIALLHDHAEDTIPEWGSGNEGLERRAQLLLVSHLGRSMVEYEVARLRDTSEGYERCRCKGFPRRTRHAVVSEFVERRADTSLAPPVARLAGIYLSAALTAPLLPNGYGLGNALNRANMTVLTDIGFNALQEFWPEIKRTLLLRRKPGP